MKSLGFTGTRNGMTDFQAAVFEGLLSDLEAFRHGSCQGADIQAARIVRKTFLCPIKIIAMPGPDDDPYREKSGVDDETLPGKTHFARNRDLVDASDEIYATPATMTEQRLGGTWYTIRYAVKTGKRVTIIWPDGSIEVR